MGSHCAGLFSTMVLGGSSSAPNLQDYARAHRKKLTTSGFLDETTRGSGVKRFSISFARHPTNGFELYSMVPSICPLETLHNSLSLKQVDDFLASIATSHNSILDISATSAVKKAPLNTYTPAKVLPCPFTQGKKTPEKTASVSGASPSKAFQHGSYLPSEGGGPSRSTPISYPVPNSHKVPEETLPLTVPAQSSVQETPHLQGKDGTTYTVCTSGPDLASVDSISWLQTAQKTESFELQPKASFSSVTCTDEGKKASIDEQSSTNRKVHDVKQDSK